MFEVKLTPENQDNLCCLLSCPEIAPDLNNIILATQEALARAQSRREMARIAKVNNQAVRVVLETAGIPLKKGVVYKLNAVILDLCLRSQYALDQSQYN